MKKNILLTGASGKLGKKIVNSNLFSSLLVPTKKELDIANSVLVENFFGKNDFDIIIHCAALARMIECENHPAKAIDINIKGTANLVKSTLNKEKNENKIIRFIFLSTDGVYQGINGDYSENGPTIPYNKYGWTKLGSECCVKLLQNHCIIRTSFFSPDNIPFESSADDMFNSKLEIKELVKNIRYIIDKGFIGTINIGGKKKSDYERYKKFKHEIKLLNYEDIIKKANINLAKDASMNIDKWERIKNE